MVYILETVMQGTTLLIENNPRTGGLILSQAYSRYGYRMPELPRTFKTVAACKAYVTRHLAGERLEWAGLKNP